MDLVPFCQTVHTHCNSTQKFLLLYMYALGCSDNLRAITTQPHLSPQHDVGRGVEVRDSGGDDEVDGTEEETESYRLSQREGDEEVGDEEDEDH